MSTNPSTKWLFISTKRCSVLLRWFLWTLILFTMVGLSILVKLIDFSPSSCFFFANLIRFSKDFNFHGITKMVSMGDNEIFPFMKCINILDLVVELLLRSTCPTFQSSTVFPFTTFTSMCLLGILALVKTSCFAPHNLFNFSNIAFSLSTQTSNNCC